MTPKFKGKRVGLFSVVLVFAASTAFLFQNCAGKNFAMGDEELASLEAPDSSTYPPSSGSNTGSSTTPPVGLTPTPTPIPNQPKACSGSYAEGQIKEVRSNTVSNRACQAGYSGQIQDSFEITERLRCQMGQFVSLGIDRRLISSTNNCSATPVATCKQNFEVGYICTGGKGTVFSNNSQAESNCRAYCESQNASC